MDDNKASRSLTSLPKWTRHWAAKTYFVALTAYLVLKVLGVVDSPSGPPKGLAALLTPHSGAATPTRSGAARRTSRYWTRRGSASTPYSRLLGARPPRQPQVPHRKRRPSARGTLHHRSILTRGGTFQMKLKPDNVPWWKAVLVVFLALAAIKASGLLAI